MTLWAGRVDSELAPEVWELVKAADAELFPYDVEGTRLHARRLAVAGILEPEELARGRGAALRARRVDDRGDRRGRALRDRAPARPGRAQDPRGPVAERPGRDGVPAVDAERVRRGNGGDRGVRGRAARPRGRARGDVDARLHASPARAARDARPPPARLGRDARPGPRPVRARGLACGAVAARRGRAGRDDAARSRRCGTRSTRSPTATSRWTTSTRARRSSSTSRGSARSWRCGRAPSSASSACPSRPRPGRR